MEMKTCWCAFAEHERKCQSGKALVSVNRHWEREIIDNIE